MAALISFFLKYLLAPLLAIILIVIITRIAKVKKKLSMKKILLFILIALLILSLPSLFALLKNEFVWGGLLLTALSYIILGIGLVFYIRSSSFKALGFVDKNDEKTYFLLVVLITLVLSTWIYYLLFDWLSNQPYSIVAMFNVSWFIVPLLFMIARDYYLKIPPPFYKSWIVQSDSSNNAFWENIDTFKLIQVTVKIKRDPNDKDYTSFGVKLPTDVIFGKWFDRFIDDQNVRFPQNVIQTKNEETGEDIGWIFYTPKWFNFPLFIRILNAEETGEENRIKNKQIIYVRRVKIKEEHENE